MLQHSFVEPILKEKCQLVCNILSRVYFRDLVTEIHYFSPLNDILAHNSEHPLLNLTNLGLLKLFAWIWLFLKVLDAFVMSGDQKVGAPKTTLRTLKKTQNHKCWKSKVGAAPVDLWDLVIYAPTLGIAWTYFFMILHLKLFTDVTGSYPSHFASREESSHFTVKAGKEEAVLSQTVAGHLSDVNALVFVDNDQMIRYFTSADLYAVVIETAQLL